MNNTVATNYTKCYSDEDYFLVNVSLSDWSHFTSRIAQDLKKDPHKNYTKCYSDQDECARPN